LESLLAGAGDAVHGNRSQISDRQAADKMRATATEYFARAEELDKPSRGAERRTDGPMSTEP